LVGWWSMGKATELGGLVGMVREDGGLVRGTGRGDWDWCVKVSTVAHRQREREREGERGGGEGGRETDRDVLMETAMTFFHFPGRASTACSSPARRFCTTCVGVVCVCVFVCWFVCWGWLGLVVVGVCVGDGVRGGDGVALA
jgi:hypothetical protein